MMRSSTSSEGPRLVRIAVLCAQTRVAIGDPRDIDAFSNERLKVLCVLRGQLSRPPILERSERRGLFFVIAWRFDRTRMSPLQWQVRAAAIDLPASRGVVY